MFHEVNLSALPTHKNVNDQQDHAKWPCRDPIFILWILFELLRLKTDPWGVNSILCTTQLLPCGFPDPEFFQTLFCFSVKSPYQKGCWSGALVFLFVCLFVCFWYSGAFFGSAFLWGNRNKSPVLSLWVLSCADRETSHFESISKLYLWIQKCQAGTFVSNGNTTLNSVPWDLKTN